MKTDSIKFYRILSGVFIIIIACLSLACIASFMEIETSKSQKMPQLNPKAPAVKIYGYSDVLATLNKESNLYIISFNSDAGEKQILKIEVKYNGSIDELDKTINSLKQDGNFHNISNIKIENLNKEDQNIGFDIFLIKNK